ncbi:MAG: helix-turn-helix domain-containing protein [Hyphomonas sp.]|uniref:helix-turn-helix domain-containing protein n=1 Tax=Hyphomonas sp. TaxID=87 RepID=UPI003003A094
MPRKKPHRSIDAKGRSKGDGQYLPIPYTMAHSAAFRSLSGPALKVWVELRSRYNGSNNGRLSLSFQNAAERLSMSKSTVKRAFDELIEKGFVRKRREGTWYGRLAAEYVVTSERLDGNAPTRDWQNWKPGQKTQKQKSVPIRTKKALSVPDGYRAPELASRAGTRRGSLRVIDGAASVLPLPSCEGGEAPCKMEGKS